MSNLPWNVNSSLISNLHKSLGASFDVEDAEHIRAALKELVEFRNRLIHELDIGADEIDHFENQLMQAIKANKFLTESEFYVKSGDKVWSLIGDFPAQIDDKTNLLDLNDIEPTIISPDYKTVTSRDKS